MSFLPTTVLVAASFTPTPHAPFAIEADDGLATLDMQPVELRRGNGETVIVQRGNLTVPVVRANPESKPITVDVWRFPAVEGADPNTPPVFRLYGGPGWPGFEPDQVDYDGDLLPMLRVADLVIVGQRGIGTSKPNTVCGPVPPTEDGSPRSQEDSAAAFQEACRSCREYWENEGYDLTGFNVIEAAQDVDDVRRLLGYDEITLWGGSFGSHWSMAVLRYHPDSVARAVLTGMEGPDHTYDSPGGVLAALERMAKEAEGAEQLSDFIPDGGLIEAFRLVIEDVEAEPIELEVEVPGTGEFELVTILPEHVRDAALGYSGRTSSRNGARTWAADVIGLFNGNFEPLAARIARDDGSTGLPTASFFMLDCGSGISPARLDELHADPAVAVVGNLSRMYEAGCPMWGSDLGDDFRAGFVSDVPTVIVQGTWDTSTPFENAVELLPSFENEHFVVVHGGSHGALNEAMGFSSEFATAILDFLATGATDALPEEIQLPELDWVAPADTW